MAVIKSIYLFDTKKSSFFCKNVLFVSLTINISDINVLIKYVTNGFKIAQKRVI